MRSVFRELRPRDVLLSLLGALILAIGLYNVHAQSDVTEGGVLGLSLFFDKVFGISPALSALLLTLLCYILGARVLGMRFILCSAISAGGYSLFYAILEQFPPLFPAIGEHPLLAALLGALFVGIGCGICVKVGGAPSGDDALAMALSHKLRLPISLVYLVSDLLVLGLSLLYISPLRILYSLLTVVLSGQIVGLIQKIGRKPSHELSDHRDRP